MVAACDAWASERTRLQEELKQVLRTPDSVLEWLRQAGAGLSDDTVLSKTKPCVAGSPHAVGGCGAK